MLSLCGIQYTTKVCLTGHCLQYHLLVLQAFSSLIFTLLHCKKWYFTSLFLTIFHCNENTASRLNFSSLGQHRSLLKSHMKHFCDLCHRNVVVFAPRLTFASVYLWLSFKLSARHEFIRMMDRMCISTHYYSWHYVKVSVRLYVVAALPPRKDPPGTHSVWGWGCHRASADASKKNVQCGGLHR
jgi:hypothetical protein